MKKIYIGYGKYLVDNEDYKKFREHLWRPHKLNLTDNEPTYAIRRIQKNNKVTRILMHREILKAPEGMHVDHIDHNGLNNCKSNLRLATRSQNLSNQRKTRGNTKYMGVHFRGKNEKYEAYVTCKGKRYHLGLFGSAVCAAIERDKKALELFGSYAKLNFSEINNAAS